MTIFIAPIGLTTEHVKTWLAEESRGVRILWLIHSKKGEETDFVKIAEQLKNDLKSAYVNLKIKLKSIDSAFEIDPTMDAISEIIHKEMDDGNADTSKEFTLNITGGTNIMAAATMLSATWHNTKAHYVLIPQKNDPPGKILVVDLPIKSIGNAKMKENHLEILKIINNSKYCIENTPNGIEPKIIEGSITRQKLMIEIHKLNNVKENNKTNKKTKKPRIRSKDTIVNYLRDTGYIEQIDFLEYYTYKGENGKPKILEENVAVQNHRDKVTIQIHTKKGEEFIEWPLKTMRNLKQIRYHITSVGKRTARDAYMFD